MGSGKMCFTGSGLAHSRAKGQVLLLGVDLGIFFVSLYPISSHSPLVRQGRAAVPDLEKQSLTGRVGIGAVFLEQSSCSVV